ncbi:hypothetical protein ODJ79_40565 [Actinoplanes sp. KI2]|uniref:hypothetical protein n=1 Tax=Actinoplanes sp. KI2 TaxID=2983315 RepID=UPI0021D5CCB3|nr:hypothetical protein [Actinoplanes sp. KI2]MCU7730046.1 hypothetical protein [Actinoplanes sp. KI2]
MADDEDLREMLERGAMLADRFLRAGPGSAGARPYLDEAITVLDRAYARLEPGGALRGQVAAQLGWFHGIRHLAHGGSAHDRTAGMHMLDESLRFANLPQIQQAGNRIMLGQLLLAGVCTPEAMTRAVTGGGADGPAEADRAISLFREVVDGPPVSAEITDAAGKLLTIAEALRGMLGGLGGMDLGKMGAALALMQNLQQGGMPAPVFSAPPSFPAPAFTSAAFADRDTPGIPHEQSPIAVVDGPMPQTPAPARSRPRPWPAPSAGELRDLGAETVDERVAVAAAVVEADGALPSDRLVLAVALADRHDADGGSGWGDGRDDLRAAAENLNRAAPALPADDVPAAVRLAERIEADLPGATRLGDGFADVTAALRDAGIDAAVYPGGVELDATSGQLRRIPDGTRRTGRVVAIGGPAEAADSFVRTAADLVALIRRGRRPVTVAPVFVANPRHDRDRATMDALRLRRTFYPRSIGLGHTVEDVTGPGTPEDVRAHLNASLLHLGCGMTSAGALELAGPAELSAADIAAGPRTPGGVAVLPPSAEGAAALADALMTRGYTAVIGFAAPVPDEVGSIVHWLLHAAMADDSLDPAAAVARVRSWLRDPDRDPFDLPPADLKLVDPVHAEALFCQGY